MTICGMPSPFSAPEPKVAGSFDRSVATEHTLSTIRELRARFGITRLGETTHLDRTGIPTMCAVVPNSPDVLSVYNGKGTTREAALASAVMEAVERQVAASPSVVLETLGVEEICSQLDLETLRLLPEARRGNAQCTFGTDLFTGGSVAVPMALVQCPWRGKRLFPTQSTNGLAAGNTYGEAVYHALIEAIERHVWSLYKVKSELVPRFYRGDDAGDEVHADRLVIKTGDALVDDLAERIVSAGFHLRVMILREALLPVVAVATIVEPCAEPPMVHLGAGCSLSPRHAVTRAITEAAQSRATDIQGSRDVLAIPGESRARDRYVVRRPAEMPKNRWTIDLPARLVRLGDLEDRSTGDLTDDIRRMLAALDTYGVRRVVAVRLSAGDLPVTVVRVVAPELETTTVDGRIGPRALDLFNPLN